MNSPDSGGATRALAVVTVAAVALAALATFTTGKHYKQDITAGTCLILDDDPEPWSPVTIWKVEVVGKRAYLVRKIPASLYQDQEGVELPFSSAYYYRVLPCPPKS